MMQVENEEKRRVRVIICRPGERAEVVEIEDKLESMQQIVEGYIEEYQPFYDEYDPREEDVTIFCNEEGKMNGMSPCRAVADKDGQILDVVRGPFFICYGPIESETIQSLPPDLEEKYLREFELPEMFFQTEKGMAAVKYVPDKRTPERDESR